MKPSILLLLCSLGFSFPALAQTESTPPPAPAVKLTAEQIELITKQLAELETQIGQLRNQNLGGIIEKLRAASSSEAAAAAFHAECEKLVSVERKELDREEARRIQERIERMNEQRRNADPKTEGDINLALKIQLQFLLLTLEAHETKDRAPLIPRLQSHIQQIVSVADKLKGRAFEILAAPVASDRNPVVAAYQLQSYLRVPQWPNSAIDFDGMWNATLLPWFKENKPEELAVLWDNRILVEGTLRKSRFSDAEFQLWSQNELPALRWVRAEYLYQHSPTPINALADMLKLIREFPGHPDSPKWLEAMRQRVTQASTGSAS